jgi:hypothetical protein
MIEDVLWALWLMAVLVVTFELATGDLCLRRRDNRPPSR